MPPSRKSIKGSVIKRLFAKSRNQCAFSGCNKLLVQDDGVVTGRICHIKASSKRGPRYDGSQSDEDRHSYGNLLLLCPEHHDIIDKASSGEWTVDRLTKMKKDHESSPAAATDRSDADRIVRQLIENHTVYEQGIQIGSINASQVNIAHGKILLGATAPETMRSGRRKKY